MKIATAYPDRRGKTLEVPRAASNERPWYGVVNESRRTLSTQMSKVELIREAMVIGLRVAGIPPEVESRLIAAALEGEFDGVRTMVVHEVDENE